MYTFHFDLSLKYYTHVDEMKDSKGFARFGTLSLQKGKRVADKHIAGYFRVISMMFHEPASDKMNTNKLIGKWKAANDTQIDDSVNTETCAHNIK